MSDTGEIIKSGAFDKLADIAHKLAGPLAEELGMLMADKVKLYRVKNWVTVVQKTEKILQDANLPPNAVPPRVFIPILEASSLEDTDTLQDLWAGLLASASEKSDSLSPSFIETLKQLTPNEAKSLEQLFHLVEISGSPSLGNPEDMFSRSQTALDSGTAQLTLETFERLGIIRRRYDLQKPYQSWWRNSRPFPSGVNVILGRTDKEPLPELTYEFEFTEYGLQFMRACKGPRKQEPTRIKQSIAIPSLRSRFQPFPIWETSSH